MKDPLQLLSASVQVSDESGRMSSAMYRMLMRLLSAIGGYAKPDAPSAITLTGSPFSWQASQPGQVFISGGSVSDVKLVRDGSEYSAPAAGFAMTPGDYVKMTYTVAPAVTFIPR